jgi:hypothetical protein
VEVEPDDTTAKKGERNQYAMMEMGMADDSSDLVVRTIDML